METVLQLDKDVIYCDTDSIKYVGDHDDVFRRYNMKVYERYQRCIDRYMKDIRDVLTGILI